MRCRRPSEACKKQHITPYQRHRIAPYRIGMDEGGQLGDSRPLVPLDLVRLGQWFSAAVDLKSGDRRPGGGVKHRTIVTGIDPVEHDATAAAAPSVCLPYLLPHCMQPEGLWQRPAAALADSSPFFRLQA